MTKDKYSRWANEGNKQVWAEKLPNGDLKIQFIDATKDENEVIYELTLTSYRAKDLADFINQLKPND